MALSRRQFFDRIRNVAEGPQRWRERRIAELRAYALERAPAHWTPEQREEAGRAVENKLVYMSDESLQSGAMHRYVDSIVQAKDLFFQTDQPETGHTNDPEYDNYYSD